jgi:hypothetical protein
MIGYQPPLLQSWRSTANVLGVLGDLGGSQNLLEKRRIQG